MKELIITDLDGTLLAPHARLDERAADILKRAVENGVSFTVATARTAATVKHILSGVKLTVPAVLMNGTAIYNLADECYERVEYLGGAFAEAVEIIHALTLAGFVYTVNDGKLMTYYESLNSPNAARFVSERQRLYGKTFRQIDDFSLLGGTVYYSISDSAERLKPAFDALSKLKDLRVEYYRDIYDDGFYYLELCAKCASKFNGVQYLRSRYGFDYVTGIGDNLNDLPLFAACDRKIAVSTAHDELKSEADELIDYDNGVGAAKAILNISRGNNGYTTHNIG